MPSIGQIAGLSGQGLGVALPLLTSLSNPVSAAIAGAVTLVALVDKIGQGRKAADKFTQKGGPQDIINKQLAAISSSPASAEEKSAATEKAWRDFLTESNKFAAANPKQATVVKQAIYKTPQLTQTVQSLLGKNPLDASYTDMAAQGIKAGEVGKNPGPSFLGTLAKAGMSAATPFLMGAGGLTGGAKAGATAGTAGAAGTAGTAAGTAAANTTAQASSSLLGRMLPNLIGAGTSLIGGVIQSRAAGRAGEIQSDAALEAARMQSEAGREAAQLQRDTARDNLAFNRDVLSQQQQNLQPWLDAGGGALREIRNILGVRRDPGPGGADLSDDMQAFDAATGQPLSRAGQPGQNGNFGFRDFAPPTSEEAAMDPAIKFQLEQGQKALEQSLRSKGISLSGKAVKAINEQAQGIAAQGFQRVRDNKAADYERAYNVFANERSARLNPLLSMAGMGQVATGNFNSVTGNAADANTAITTGAARTIGDINMTTARGVGDLTGSAAAARASGYVGGANAVGGSIANIGNQVLDAVTIRDLMRRLPVGGPS